MEIDYTKCLGCGAKIDIASFTYGFIDFTCLSCNLYSIFVDYNGYVCRAVLHWNVDTYLPALVMNPCFDTWSISVYNNHNGTWKNACSGNNVAESFDVAMGSEAIRRRMELYCFLG